MRGNDMAHMLETDLLDPAVWTAGIPYAAWDAARERDRVMYYAESEFLGRPYWSITGHRELRAVSRNPRKFINALGQNFQDTPETLPSRQAGIIYLDPPDHGRVRDLVARYFTGPGVAPLESRVRQIVRDRIAAVRDRETFDLPNDLTLEIPSRVISWLIGVPEDRREHLVRKAIDLFADVTGTEEGYAVQAAAIAEVWALADDLAEEKRRNPTDDIATVLSQALDAGRLSDPEYKELLVTLIAGGQETTRNTMAFGTLRLLREPELLADITANPEIIPTFFDEILRFDSPFSAMARHASEDVELMGRQIRKGELVGLWLGAANRDPLEFDNPNVFDPRRSPNRHVSFGGGGPHFCLGSLLARMQACMFFEEMLPYFPRLELVAEPERHITTLINAVRSAPLRWTS